MAARLCAPCTYCCRGFGNIMLPDDRPSPIFSTFAVIINLVMVIWSAVELSRDCSAEPMTWLILGLLSAVVNIVFAIYLYARFAHKVRREGVDPGHAACSLFLFDWGVCLYILFVAWLIVWMVFAARVKYDDNTRDEDSCGDMLIRGVVIFIIYLVVGFLLMGCSVCTEGCRTPRWQRNNASVVTAQPAHVNSAPYAHPVHRGPVARIKDALFGRAHPHQPQPYQAQPYQAQAVNTGFHHGGSQHPPAQNPHYAV